jgi:hypothetical protein
MHTPRHARPAGRAPRGPSGPSLLDPDPQHQPGPGCRDERADLSVFGYTKRCLPRGCGVDAMDVTPPWHLARVLPAVPWRSDARGACRGSAK